MKIAVFIFRKIKRKTRTLRHRLGLEYFQFDFVAQSGTLWLSLGEKRNRKTYIKYITYYYIYLYIQNSFHILL